MTPALEQKWNARTKFKLSVQEFIKLEIASRHAEACRCDYCLFWWRIAEKEDFDHNLDCPFRPDELRGRDENAS